MLMPDSAVSFLQPRVCGTKRRFSVSYCCFLSLRADRRAGDVSFTVCFFVCLSAKLFVMDISGVGQGRVMKYGRMVDLDG